MLSTFGVLPSNQSVIDDIPIPVNIFIEPLSQQAKVVEIENAQIPRCTRCRSYLSVNCAISDNVWCCGVCSQIMKLSKCYIPKENVVEIIEQPECMPLHHILVIFTPVRETVRSYLSSLPPNAPLTVYTYTDHLIEFPMSPVSQIIEEFDSIEISKSSIPFSKYIDSLSAILSYVQPPSWVRVFMESPPSSIKSHPIETILTQLYEKEVRVDFFIQGKTYSELLNSIVKKSPGICCVSAPFAGLETPSALMAEAKREFAFQLLAIFRPGVTYTSEFSKSSYTASKESKNYIRIPVLPARSASLTFKLTPPTDHNEIRQQAMQCVVKYSKWNPKTNKISRLFRIISHEFKISSNFTTVLDSVNPSLLFCSWLQQAQLLPAGQMSARIIDNMKELVPVVIAHPHLQPLVRMTFLAKSHPALSTGFWDRLTMGSLLSLSSPLATDAQFSFSVEIWKDCETHIKTVFSCTEKDKDESNIFLIRSFPSLFLLSKDGHVDIPPESALQRSIDSYITECEPLSVKFVQTQTASVIGLLTVDDEEGLPEFLESIRYSMCELK